jgi:hypothetical protein
MTSGNQSGHTLPSDELGAALAAGGQGGMVDTQAVEAYLAGVESAIDSRVDARVEQRLQGTRGAAVSRATSFTGRAIGSLAVGIPLTAVAGAIAGNAGGVGSVLGVLGSLAAIVTLNIYYTEVEKDLEKERIRAGKQP